MQGQSLRAVGVEVKDLQTKMPPIKTSKQPIYTMSQTQRHLDLHIDHTIHQIRQPFLHGQFQQHIFNKYTHLTPIITTLPPIQTLRHNNCSSYILVPSQNLYTKSVSAHIDLMKPKKK